MDEGHSSYGNTHRLRSGCEPLCHAVRTRSMSGGAAKNPLFFICLNFHLHLPINKGTVETLHKIHGKPSLQDDSEGGIEETGTALRNR
jgi:hypothetical protein